MSLEIKKKNIAMRLLAVIVLFGLLGVGIYRMQNPPEHPKLGEARKNLQAGNFSVAAGLLRLVLQDQPDNYLAKGLLLFAVERETLSEYEGEELEPEDFLLSEYVEFTVLLKTEEILPLFREKGQRLEVEKLIKEAKTRRKELFAANRVPFKDWEDFRVATEKAAQEIFYLKVLEEDNIDARSKDLAAVSLVSRGDKVAAKYLIERIAKDPELLTLAMITGDKLSLALKDEAQKTSSFLNDDAGFVAALTSLGPELVDFNRNFGPFRTPTALDLTVSQRELIKKDDWSYRLADPFSRLMLASAAKQGQFDPGATLFRFSGNSDVPIAVLSGFNPKKRHFVTIALLYDSGQFKKLSLVKDKTKVLITKQPVAERVYWDDKTLAFRIAEEKFDFVPKSREELKYRTVTKYYRSLRYDSNAYQGYGGYVPVDVPISVEEPYFKDVKYKELARGATWHSYKFNDKSKDIDIIRKIWVSDSSDYDEVAKKFAASSGSGTSNEANSGDNAEDISDLIDLAMKREISAKDLADLSTEYIRKVRNGIFAKKGYVFKDSALNRYFENFSWYRPTTRDPGSVEASLTAIQLKNIEFLKEREYAVD